MPTCHVCGNSVQDTSQPCSECGSVLESPEDLSGSQAPVPVAPDASSDPDGSGAALPRLTLLQSGRDTGTVYEGLSPGSVIGRFDPDTGPIEVDLGQLPESGYVSRRHAELSQQSSGQWSIKDLESSNGTFVKSGAGQFERITDEHMLQSGDVIAFGNVQFRFAV